MIGARIDRAYHAGKCAKCNGLGITTKQDPARDLLVNTCRRCGYEWTDAPMDARKGDDKPERLRFGGR